MYFCTSVCQRAGRELIRIINMLKLHKCSNTSHDICVLYNMVIWVVKFSEKLWKKTCQFSPDLLKYDAKHWAIESQILTILHHLYPQYFQYVFPIISFEYSDFCQKYIFNFLILSWKLDNPYYHTVQSSNHTVFSAL